MPPKKTAGAATATKKTSSSHASYKDMIKEAILNLKERNGSSRQAIKKYVKANNKDLKYGTESQFDALFNKALRTGVEKGEFTQPKGTSGPVKLAKKESAPAEKKPAPKKEAATKEAKPAAPKKVAAKKSDATKATKPATKKAPVKKAAATKAKANTAKPRTKATKTEAPAPAVTETPTVLKKTKSGRVSKQKATTTKKAATGTKKAAAAAPKKKATPKKAEASS